MATPSLETSHLFSLSSEQYAVIEKAKQECKNYQIAQHMQKVKTTCGQVVPQTGEVKTEYADQTKHFICAHSLKHYRSALYKAQELQSLDSADLLDTLPSLYEVDEVIAQDIQKGFYKPSHTHWRTTVLDEARLLAFQQRMDFTAALKLLKIAAKRREMALKAEIQTLDLSQDDLKLCLEAKLTLLELEIKDIEKLENKEADQIDGLFPTKKKQQTKQQKSTKTISKEGETTETSSIKKKTAILYLAEDLRENYPYLAANVSYPTISGAMELAEIQANRINSGKALHDYVFIKQTALEQMKDVITDEKQRDEPAANPAKAIHNTLVHSNLLLASNVDWSQYEKIIIQGNNCGRSNHLIQGANSYCPREIIRLLMNVGAIEHIKKIFLTGPKTADGTNCAYWVEHQPKQLLQQFGAEIIDLDTKGSQSQKSKKSTMVRSVKPIEIIKPQSRMGIDQYLGEKEQNVSSCAEAFAQQLGLTGFAGIDVVGYLGTEQRVKDAERKQHFRRVAGEEVRRNSPDVKIHFNSDDYLADLNLPEISFE